MTLREFEKKLWIKWVLYLTGMSLYMYLIFLLFNHLTHGEIGNPLVSSILVLFMGLILPFFFKIVLLRKRKTTRDYESAENIFEKSADSLILKTFGPERFEKLYFDDRNYYPVIGIEICLEMLHSDKSHNDSDLRFSLYVKIAKYYANDNRPNEAIDSLRSALLIKPTSLIANYRIATLFESVGLGKDAITHYELAQKDTVVSSDLKEYLLAQVQRVKTNGPRSKGPWEDSGFQWISG